MDVKQVMTGSWVSRKVALITGYAITAAFQGSKREALFSHERCYMFHVDTERQRERERFCVTTSDTKIIYV
jgi:hypothetical protein